LLHQSATNSARSGVFANLLISAATIPPTSPPLQPIGISGIGLRCVQLDFGETNPWYPDIAEEAPMFIV